MAVTPLAIRVIFENGDYFYTAFNGTKEEIITYYIGKMFNLGNVDDDMQKCVAVEFLS